MSQSQGKPERFLNATITGGETISYIVPAGCVATVLGASFVVTPPIDTGGQFYVIVAGEPIAVVIVEVASEQTPLQYEWLGLGPLAIETEEISLMLVNPDGESTISGQVWGMLYSGIQFTT
jgi:hypothetical protein